VAAGRRQVAASAVPVQAGSGRDACRL